MLYGRLPGQGSNGEHTEMKARVQIEHQHKATVRELYETIDRHDFDTFKEFFASDGICHIAGAPKVLPIEVGIQFIQSFCKAFPDSLHTIKDIIAERDKVAVRFVLDGSHKGEFSGIAATGNPIKSEGIHIYWFVEGKIGEMWIVEDKLSLMQQLGMELKPKEKE